MSVIHYLLLHQWVFKSSKWAYVNITERSHGENLTSIAKNSYSTDNSTMNNHKIHHYEDYPGISYIKDKVKPPNNWKYWKDTKGINNRKINTGLLAGHLSQSVKYKYKSIKDGLFPENALGCLLLPWIRNRWQNLCLNYNSIICVLNQVSNIHENILKTQLIEKMNKLFLPFIFVYNIHMYLLDLKNGEKT